MRRFFGALIFASLFVGCESQPAGDLPTLYPVKGRVVRGERGVTGAIRFRQMPETTESTNYVVVAELQADGSFELTTIHAVSQKRALGAPAGSYQVTYNAPLADQTTSPDGILPPLILPTSFSIPPNPTELKIDLSN